MSSIQIRDKGGAYMEPVNINQIQNSMQMGATHRAQTINTPDRQQEAQESTARRASDNAGRAASQAEDSAAKGMYGDVLDISEDGETVTARPEALQKLEDGMVTLKPAEDEDKKSVTEMETESAEKRAELIKERQERAEESREARQAIREEREAEAEAKAAETTAQYNSLSGYPDNMVDTLYRQGKIDSRTYNSEIDRRERLDEMRGTGGEDENGARVGENNAFNEEMTGINAQGEREERETEALFNAAENGRIDIAKDIFTDNEKN